MLKFKEIHKIHKELSSNQELIPLSRAKNDAPKSAGIYAIYIDSTQSLPSLLKKELDKRNINCEFKNLLYIGKANNKENRNLKQRLVNEALMGGTHTFFRGLGAVLGYTPPPGSLCGYENQSNFKFNDADTRKIVQFIEQHIRVRWCETSVSAKSLDRLETNLIEKLTPLMNTKKNPDKCQLVSELREKCRNIARGK